MTILWIILFSCVGLIIGGLLGTSKRADLVNEVRILRIKLFKAEEDISECKRHNVKLANARENMSNMQSGKFLT